MEMEAPSSSSSSGGPFLFSRLAEVWGRQISKLSISPGTQWAHSEERERETEREEDELFMDYSIYGFDRYVTGTFWARIAHWAPLCEVQFYKELELAR